MPSALSMTSRDETIKQDLQTFRQIVYDYIYNAFQ